MAIQPNLSKIKELNSQASSKKTELKQIEDQIVVYQNSQRDLAQAAIAIENPARQA